MIEKKTKTFLKNKTKRKTNGKEILIQTNVNDLNSRSLKQEFELQKNK